jgi:hypothetical protein
MTDEVISIQLKGKDENNKQRHLLLDLHHQHIHHLT